MFCINCGANNQHEGKFCFQCGKALVVNDALVGDSHEQTKLQADSENSQQVIANTATISTEKASGISRVHNFFITVWQGEWGLAKTYWIIGVVLGSLLGVVLNPSNHAGILSLVLMVVIMAYQTWSLVGIWRAAGKHRGAIAWRYLSRGAALIGTVFVFVVAAGVFKQGLSEFGAVQKSAYQIGDTWHFKNDATKDDFSHPVKVEISQGDQYRNRMTSYTSRSGQKGHTYSDPFDDLDFPIKPGKTWKETSPNGQRVDIYAVLEWETIEVAAGVFRALKIQHIVHDHGVKTEYVSWYSPKVKYRVKHQIDGLITEELLSYSLK